MQCSPTSASRWSVSVFRSAATFSFIVAGLSQGSLGAPLPGDEVTPQGEKGSPKPPPSDSLLLNDGKSLSGTLRDWKIITVTFCYVLCDEFCVLDARRSYNSNLDESCEVPG